MCKPPLFWGSGPVPARPRCLARARSTWRIGYIIVYLCLLGVHGALNDLNASSCFYHSAFVVFFFTFDALAVVREAVCYINPLFRRKHVVNKHAIFREGFFSCLIRSECWLLLRPNRVKDVLCLFVRIVPRCNCCNVTYAKRLICSSSDNGCVWYSCLTRDVDAGLCLQCVQDRVHNALALFPSDGGFSHFPWRRYRDHACSPARKHDVRDSSLGEAAFPGERRFLWLYMQIDEHLRN